jgi:hypothetical protein
MSSALIFMMLPKNAGEDMTDRTPSPNESSDQKVG